MSGRHKANDSIAVPPNRPGRFMPEGHRVHLFPALLVLLVVALGAWSALADHSAGQSLVSKSTGAIANGTPVSAMPDPLDGPGPEVTVTPDPLDGEPQIGFQADDGAPEDFDQLPVVRSGRSRGAPDSSVAYDGDLSTYWSVGEVDNRWVWFDLGRTARIRELRWFTTGLGSQTVELSIDREKWQEIGNAPLEDGWSGLAMREDARFVRLTFSDDASDDATLLEFAAYGRSLNIGAGGSRAVELAQERKQRASNRQEQRDNNRQDRKAKGERRAQRATNNGPAAERDANDDTSGSGVQISTKPGKTKCKGDKARCQAKEGKTKVEDDCAAEGTCVIDVRADGGAAICDASGGDKNETGQGEGKRPGRGGRCEATADGGTVTIGDINP